MSNEALRLADACKHGWLENVDPDKCGLEDLLALLRQQAERIAELEATQAGIMQAITDPENQPSQYGTVTLDYLSDKLKAWEDKWFKRDQQANTAEAERDQLRAEVERLRAESVPLGAIRGIAVEAIRDVSGCPDLSKNGRHLSDALEETARHATYAAIDHARTTHKDGASA